MSDHDRTHAARQQRYKARQCGEVVPLRKGGRPPHGASPFIESATLDQLLAAAYRRLDARLPADLENGPEWYPGMSEEWNILCGIEKLQLARNRAANR